MVVILPLFTILLIAYQAPTARDKHKRADYPAKADGAEHDKLKNTPELAVGQQTINCEPRESESKGKAASGPDHSHDWIDKLNAFSTSIIAVFTILLFVGVVLQVCTSRDIERAWIIATNVDPLKEIEYQRDSGPIMEFSYPNNFTNSGRTPARVTKAHVRFHLVPPRKDAVDEPDLPEKPDYGPPVIRQIPKDGRIVVPQEKFTIVVRFEGSNERPAIMLNRQERDAVYAGTMMLVTYGLIEYRDAFQKPRELRFCRVYHYQRGFDPLPTGFYLGGPSEYNKAS